MYSITHGHISFDQMFNIIKGFVDEKPTNEYHISIGTDSQNFNLTKTIIVVAIHRVGSGGIFFIDKKEVAKITNVRQKIFYETNESLKLAMKLSEKFEKEGFKYGIGIHVDAGHNGSSAQLISEISAWVRACGFDCKTKPESYAASTIADKFTK